MFTQLEILFNVISEQKHEILFRIISNQFDFNSGLSGHMPINVGNKCVQNVFRIRQTLSLSNKP